MTAFIFDTNALVYLSKAGMSIIPQYHHISIISELELLSYPKLTKEDESQLNHMLGLFQIHTISQEIKAQTIRLRRNKKLKLPDSIIVATAQVLECRLVTNDKQILNVVPDNAISFDSISPINL